MLGWHAMNAIRQSLLCAFAGGCLSSVVVLGLWRADEAASAQKQVAHHAALPVSSSAATSPKQAPEIADDPKAPAPSSVAHAEPSIVEAEAAAPAPAGSAVSDVLMDLEAAYRRRLAAAAAPEEAPVASAPAPATPDVARVEPPPVAAPAVAPVAAVAPVPIAPAAVAPVAPAAAEVPPPVAAAPVLVAQADSRPPDVHIGDINNTYVTNVTNVRQGEVYLMQQQVAMMQYMQLLGASSYAARPGHVGSGVPGPAARESTNQFRQFPSTLTNLDNPWGFNFAPPNLVH